jgi:benzoyl-CoA reductase/2-hydroxyglutaryl-CoA dehydratase subunit BcrC/BadD/HgdB
MTVDRTASVNMATLHPARNKLVGYYCCYLPVELFTAAGVTPYRIIADPLQDTGRADAVLETVLCPWHRGSPCLRRCAAPLWFLETLSQAALQPLPGNPPHR